MKATWILVAVLMLPVCAYAEGAKPTKQEISAMIRRELPVGASPSDIEAFFRKHKIQFSWDRFTGIYVAIIRNVEPFHSITIDISVDDKRRFVGAEVQDTYVAP